MELWELVRTVSQRYGQRLEQHKQAHPRAKDLGELTVQQFQYLQALHASPTPTISFLSTYFGVRSPTATVIVARLVERGFLKKAPDLQDKRSNRLVLTPKARKILEVQESAFRALGDDIRTVLSSSDLQAYVHLTEQVCNAFARLDQIDSKVRS